MKRLLYIGIFIILAAGIFLINKTTNDKLTPSIQLGYDSLTRFASPETIVRDKELLYSVPHQIRQNYVAYGGVWEINANSSHPLESSYLKLSFKAKEVYLLMKPIKENASSSVKVILDDQEREIISVDSDRLYELIKLNDVGNHILKLEFLDHNVELSSFSFN